MKTALDHQVPGLLSRADASGKQRDEMFALLSRHFDGVSREQFERDLAEKNWVVEIRREERLLGFSTLLATDAEFNGDPITAIYSGDTIVAPEAWGSPMLARAWIHSVNALRTIFPGRPCYWLLLTSGFRTYRFLPVFWREFFPRFDIPTPIHRQRLMDHLARGKYGNLYDPASGIVRFQNPQRLRGDIDAVISGRVADPHIAFFLSRNRGHAEGDELACFTEITEANLTPAGRRMVAVAPR